MHGLASTHRFRMPARRVLVVLVLSIGFSIGISKIGDPRLSVWAQSTTLDSPKPQSPEPADPKTTHPKAAKPKTSQRRLSNSRVDDAIQLRRAWIHHRLEARLDQARTGYLRLTRESTDPDLRARAALGLVLLAIELSPIAADRDEDGGKEDRGEEDRGEEDRGEEDRLVAKPRVAELSDEQRGAAMHWLRFIKDLDGVSPRWKTIARAYVDRVRAPELASPLIESLDGLVKERERQLRMLQTELVVRRSRLRSWEGCVRRLDDHLLRLELDPLSGNLVRGDTDRSAAKLASSARPGTRRRLIAAHLDRARAKLAVGNYRGVIEETMRALREDPFHPEAQLLRRRGLAGKFAWEAARRGASPEDRASRAREAARRELIRGLESELSDGLGQERRGRVAEAIVIYDRVLQWFAREPKNAPKEGGTEPIPPAFLEAEQLAVEARSRLTACLQRTPDPTEARRLVRRGDDLDAGLDELARAFRATDRALDRMARRVAAVRRRYPDVLREFARSEAAGLGFASDHASSAERRKAQLAERQDLSELIPELSSPELLEPSPREPQPVVPSLPDGASSSPKRGS